MQMRLFFLKSLWEPRVISRYRFRILPQNSDNSKIKRNTLERIHFDVYHNYRCCWNNAFSFKKNQISRSFFFITFVKYESGSATARSSNSLSKDGFTFTSEEYIRAPIVTKTRHLDMESPRNAVKL